MSPIQSSTRRASPPCPALWLAAATLATACTSGPAEDSPHEVVVTDSLTALGSEGPGELPRFATGTRFELVLSSEATLEDGWVIAAADPDILSVEPTVRIDDVAAEADAQAIAAGETTIEAYDEADRIAASVPVQVRDVDRVALTTVSGSFAYAVGERVRLLADNDMNLAIDYVGGDELLAGRGLLEVESETDLARIGLLGARPDEGLHVRALPSGSYTVQLRINGRDAGALEVISVEPADVELVLQGPDQDSGEHACAWVALEDAVERRVFADLAVWTSDGERLGEGDMLCIAVDPTAPPMTTTVTYGPFTETIELPGGEPQLW
jgi:hypothetical protein